MHGVADPVAEVGSESDKAPAKARKCSGKRLKEWKILEDINGTHQRAQEALTVTTEPFLTNR
jgi:hypothetical protein